MSDPTIEEDSLISQDDIDKLLDSSSIEEAEENFPDNNADTMDELGELSQDDIDSLMNSNASGREEDPVAEDDFEDDDMELISQDDIDSLMNTAPQEEASSSDEDVDEDFEMISQEDVNNLMGGQSEDTRVDSKTEDKDGQDSLQVEEEIIDQRMEPGIQEDDYVIDESEAMDVQDSLITQKTIDDLINDFDNEAPSDPVILDEDPIPDSEDRPESEPEPDPVAESEESNGQEDPDDFLKPDSDVTVLDFDDEEAEDVTQDDIDALLLESDDDAGEDEEDEDDILISQDDIDTLLMAADQEDEDVLGDLMDNDFDVSMDDEVGDEDILEGDSFAEDDNEDQVVLEGDDEKEVAAPEKKKAKSTSRWYRSKLVIACASVLIILGITVPITYFIFFSGGSNKEAQLEPVQKLAAQTQREIEIETVDINMKTQPDIKKPGNMVLKNFVILAPDISKDMTYITADISIDYSDQRAFHEIQNNLSFYRDLIYDSINKSLISEKRQNITEADILWIVETSLKKVLPGHYIDRVSFKSFKAS